jgi:hypothetical protein
LAIRQLGNDPFQVLIADRTAQILASHAREHVIGLLDQEGAIAHHGPFAKIERGTEAVQ